MSFTSEVRDELARIIEQQVCCRKAELTAMVRLMGVLGGNATAGHRIEISTESAPVARKAIKLSHLTYNLKTELMGRRSVLHKSNNYLITIPTQRPLKLLLDEGGLMGGTHHTWGIYPPLVKHDRCAIAYLRGAFLATGFIADPKGDLHFEIVVHNETLAQDIKELMDRFSISPKIIERRGQWTVYLKGAEPIIDFLALVGAHKALLDTEDKRVYKSIRNDINRQVNAEIANQAKAGNAALEQLAAIRIIAEKQGLDSLPPALHETAQLRMNNPDISLRELGEKAKPPLSKSAINHRIRRIEKIAAELSEG